MKFLRLGFVAALALSLAGQALAAAPAAVKIDPAARATGMKEAPAAVQAAGVDCTVSDAYLKGNGETKVAGKSVKTSVYEVACGPSMGYIIQTQPGADAQSYDCLALKELADRAAASKQKPTACDLPGNADPKQGLVPVLTKAGGACTQVTAARFIGSSPSEKVGLFEAVCSGGTSYILTEPMKGSTKTLSVTDCVKSATIGVACTLTTADQQAQGIIKASEAAKRPACAPTKARYVVSDPSNGNDYWEVGCADGKTGYMFQTEKDGKFKQAIECVLATRIADGCKLSSADAGQTAEAPTYTKLVKAAGYDCDVSKYQSYGTEKGGQREVVELACGNHPDGAFAMVPTGSNQTGEYFNCVRAQVRGFACRLTPVEATYTKISSQIAARGKTTCTVNGARGIGKIASGTEFIEVTCAGAPNLVLGYSRLPQETLVSALPCAQAEVNDACKLPPSK